jgi:hypothetical protein
MARPHPVHPAGIVGELELRSLVDAIGAALDLGPGDPARLVRVRAAAGDPELELGFCPLEPGAHPLEALVGFVAPPDWTAIGVACTGKARHLDHRAVAVPVAIVQLVARSGAWASSWVPLGPAGEPAAAGEGLREAGSASGADQGAATGRVDDALRRALGLTTSPPVEGTARLWASQWLDTLLAGAALERGGTTRRRRTLATLVAAHPAAQAFDLDPACCRVADLISHGTRLGVLRSWSQLRGACADGRWSHEELSPATAAWLDDGAFSRWLLGAYPELGELRDALGDLLAPSALSVIDDALDAWALSENH